jgi:hypothetical protein
MQDMEDHVSVLEEAVDEARDRARAAEAAAAGQAAAMSAIDADLRAKEQELVDGQV